MAPSETSGWQGQWTVLGRELGGDVGRRWLPLPPLPGLRVERRGGAGRRVGGMDGTVTSAGSGGQGCFSRAGPGQGAVKTSSPWIDPGAAA